MNHAIDLPDSESLGAISQPLRRKDLTMKRLDALLSESNPRLKFLQNNSVPNLIRARDDRDQLFIRKR